MEKVLFTTEETAQYLSLEPQTLAKWRCQYPEKLPFFKDGRTIRYRKSDVDNYIAKHICGAEDEFNYDFEGSVR
jgi:excisionase family DNA binding protein